MSEHTCLNCNVKFQTPDIQRDHYKTDWHRYNLKRRVADLPPVTAEEFQKRLLQQRTADQKAQEPVSLHCAACRKQFISDKSYENHLNSKKHRENVLIAEKNAQATGRVTLLVFFCVEEIVTLNGEIVGNVEILSVLDFFEEKSHFLKKSLVFSRKVPLVVWEKRDFGGEIVDK